MDSEDAVYGQLRDQIDKMPVGMPKTESGVEIKILKYLFTPEEARIALHLNILPEPLERIHKRVRKNQPDITPKGLEEILDGLVAKGSILLDEKNRRKHYSYALFAIGMYEFQVDRMPKEFYEDAFSYIGGEFRHEYARTDTPQIRTIPIQTSITPELNVATYDDMKELVKKTEGQFGVMNCICKQGKDLIGEKCGVTDLRETCLLFPGMDLSSFKPGTVRPISKEEAQDILRRAEEEGLVIQPSNSQNPEFVCCCCGDCCAVLTAAKRFPEPVKLFATNYYAEVDLETCTGCEKCVDRCQMEAINMVDGKAIVDLNRCIGCGLCIPVCEEGSRRLTRKEKETIPPETTDDLYRKIMTKRTGNLGMLKIGIKMLLKQKI